MNGFPCRDCTARTPGCHAGCEAYLAYKKRRDDQLLAYRQEQQGYRSALAQAVDGAVRARRRRGKK